MYWPVKTKQLAGTSYSEVYKKASQLFKEVKGKSKRKLYIRSKYFAKRKVFFDYYFDHLFQKPKKQRISRLKLLPCAIELVRENTYKPVLGRQNNDCELLYRFFGKSESNCFAVQVKQTKKSLQFISVFPWK